MHGEIQENKKKYSFITLFIVTTRDFAAHLPVFISIEPSEEVRFPAGLVVLDSYHLPTAGCSWPPVDSSSPFSRPGTVATGPRWWWWHGQAAEGAGDVQQVLPLDQDASGLCFLEAASSSSGVAALMVDSRLWF